MGLTINPNNIVILVGELLTEPELKQTSNGKSRAQGRISVARAWAREGEEPARDYFFIGAWGAEAETLARAKKGDIVEIKGELESKSYETDSGEKRNIVEVVIKQIKRVEELSAAASAPVDIFGDE
jgi:single-strand DNA-binding protein